MKRRRRLTRKEKKEKFKTVSAWIREKDRKRRRKLASELDKVARARQSEWWARNFDELFFMYGSGARGINAEIDLLQP